MRVSCVTTEPPRSVKLLCGRAMWLFSSTSDIWKHYASSLAIALTSSATIAETIMMMIIIIIFIFKEPRNSFPPLHKPAIDLSWARWIQFLVSQPTSFKSILILFTHLNFSLPKCLIPSLSYAFFIIPYVLHVLPISVASIKDS